MKKFIKLLSVVMVLVMCFGMANTVFALSYGNFEYKNINNGTEIELTKYTGTSESYVNIPSSINGITVTSIGEKCFDGHAEVSNIVIPSSITHFGDFAFRGTAWLEDQVDDFIARNGILIKYNGTAKGTLTLPENIKTIGYGAFDFSEFSEITLHDSVEKILDEAFYGCANMKSISIPKNVTQIGNDVFAKCMSLESITVDAENKLYASEQGVLFSKDMETLIRYPQGKLYAYDIPESVKKLTPFAFAACSNLSTVTIPAGVSEIPNSAFYECSNLSVVTILGDITHIGEWAFAYCASLASVGFPKSLESIGYAAFMNCDSLNDVSISSDIKTVANHSLGYYIVEGTLIAARKNNFSIHIDNPEDVKYTETLIYKYISSNGINFTVENDFERMQGDLNDNGKIDVSDARIALRSAVNIENLTPGQLIAGDLNGNGVISVSEARKILRVAVKIDSSF